MPSRSKKLLTNLFYAKIADDFPKDNSGLAVDDCRVTNSAQPNVFSDLSSRHLPYSSDSWTASSSLRRMLSSLASSTKCCGRADERKMAATILSSCSSLPRATAKLAGVPRSSSYYTQLTFFSRHPFEKAAAAAAAFQRLPPELLRLSYAGRNNKHARTSCGRATDNDQAAPAAAQETTANTPPPPASPVPSAERSPVTPGNNGQPQQPVANANGSAPSEPPKRAPLTARERLRAARVLGKYAEPSAKGSSSSSSKSAKPEFGSGVLDALREADAKKGRAGGGRRGSRLPEAPGNLFDDSKRGMPKEGWTFELPFGVDVFLVLVSFTLITTIMFGTAFLVWKLGAIHFNEY